VDDPNTIVSSDGCCSHPLIEGAAPEFVPVCGPSVLGPVQRLKAHRMVGGPPHLTGSRTAMETVHIVKLFDRVSVDGHPGSAVAFFDNGRERSVLVRFDDMQVREIPESRVTVGALRPAA
jgi:hypothetical protein